MGTGTNKNGWFSAALPKDVKEKIAIPTLPLAEVLERHLPPGQTIDFMNVDVEGHDLEVLESNDWQRFRPKVIVVEDEGLDPRESAIVRTMKTHGYELCAQNVIILDKIKPYERPDGNSVLYALSALDNDDKHNLLTPSVSIARIDGISGFDAQHGIVLRDQTVILAGDTQMGVIGVPGQFQIADHGRATAEIVFAKEGVLQGQAVLPALCQLLQIVAGAVQAIEDTYRA